MLGILGGVCRWYRNRLADCLPRLDSQRVRCLDLGPVPPGHGTTDVVQRNYTNYVFPNAINYPRVSELLSRAGDLEYSLKTDIVLRIF